MDEIPPEPPLFQAEQSQLSLSLSSDERCSSPFIVLVVAFH